MVVSWLRVSSLLVPLAVAFACTSTTEHSKTGAGGAGAGGTSGASGASSSAGASGGAAGTPPCNDGGVLTDENNCGSCGHSCLGGGCVAGKCQPAVVFSKPGSSSTSGTLGPLVADGLHLFVGDSGDLGKSVLTGALWVMDLDGKNFERLDPGGSTEVVALASDSTTVYWTSAEGELKAVNKEGGAVSSLVSDPVTMHGVAVSGKHAFYVGGTTVKQVYLVGNKSWPLTGPLPNPRALAVSGGALYLTTMGNGPGFLDGTVSRIAVDLGDSPSPTLKTVEPLVLDQFSPGPLATDATHVYWSTAEGDIHRMAFVGAAPEYVAKATDAADQAPQAIAVDEAHVYWTSWGACVTTGCTIQGRVQRAPKAGGSKKEVLAEGEMLPTGIAVAQGAVYWTNWWFASVSRLAL
ncbi:MAG: hypothetical protein HS104_07250 [Polyangiaceae bacterium]|nr:hypothetical protein [Polyangiaceae bacterium]MCE7892677.1 hypothetical protein [Sorangiineae bacterium PRO1]MCL4755301.1 hypothetical protein [Myxococcales bacterium]